jgi:hypothetical protein
VKREVLWGDPALYRRDGWSFRTRGKVRDGETPSPTRETRALPRTGFRLTVPYFRRKCVSE